MSILKNDNYKKWEEFLIKHCKEKPKNISNIGKYEIKKEKINELQQQKSR